MLPSKGYFKSIDCPFYSSNLCHRFYCHYRHHYKDVKFLDLQLSNETETDNEIIISDLSFVNLEERKRNTVNEPVCSKGSAQVKGGQTYLRSTIPQYNPTPISELKRYKNEKKENLNCNTHVNKTYNLCLEQNKCKDIINYTDELTDYIEKSNVASDKTSSAENTELIENKDQTNSDCSYESADNNVYENTIKSLQRKRKKVQKTKTEKIKNEKREEKEFHSKENVDDKQGNKKYENVTDNENKNDNSKALQNHDDCHHGRENVESTNNEILVIKQKTRDSFKDSNNQHSKIISDLKSSGKKSKNKHKKLSVTNTKKYKEQKLITDCNTAERTTDHNVTPQESKYLDQEITIVNSDIDLIVISDSEESVTECINVEEQTEKEEISPKAVHDFPQPKKKIRISHVKSTTQDNSKVKSIKEKLNEEYLKQPSAINPDYPQLKQKTRIARNQFGNELVSIQSMKEYLSHWQSVKERVQKKCINPSGEEGYQNWSQVKINPVSNVASLLNSKKLLDSKIQQWNLSKK